MSAITAHVVRRSIELGSDLSDKTPGQVDELHPPGALVALAIFSFLILALVTAAIDYTYGNVVATLAAVEDSNPDIYVRIDHDDPNKPLNPADPEPAANSPLKPVTSSLRATIRHLRARAGFWSRFRGLSMYLTMGIVRGVLASLIVPVGSFLGQFVVQSLISILFSTWQMTWVHIVITEPSPKRFYQRLPKTTKTWFKIAPAAALVDIASAAAVVFVRVAASMLPEEDETIVPFDRSFGGKVNPEIVGGSGKIGLVDAWTTFDWPARVRLAKVIGKTFAMQLAVGVVGFLVLGIQIYFMVSKSSKTQPPASAPTSPPTSA
ncbi:hypothetical protein N7468_009749 [Penicillium chermesinum]|uniref:Uncharacterized protein n=1 Tax=Penicillium chermesinum TaxID=63820 RepID=A0A9W9NIG2_9EURO|nr:uncharacterized protein N7468_009749 [Penicillium chermesinum]KAJ5220545.1 hypothetical protein N7468_009749 [Penicillium chermesinum]